MAKEKTSPSTETVKKRRKTRKTGCLVILLIVLAGTFLLYHFTFQPNVKTPDKKDLSVFIPTGSSFKQVKDSLFHYNLIVNKSSFELIASMKDCENHVHPGRYVIKNGMSNHSITGILRGGLQTPMKVTFNNMRTVDMLSGRISKQIEADSVSIASRLHDNDYISRFGFNTKTIPAMFLPNTYEFYWNTDAETFIDKMHEEYTDFWTEERQQLAANKGLTPIEVSILASIVDKETNKTDEMPRIAGVYLNRLKSGWPLQADPTLIFAIGDFDIHRVLAVHKQIDSPYNTYKYAGLPPGPICIPSLAAINSVLNAENHNYYYFCAKEDLSGYHYFSKTLDEHNRYAAKFQQALNERGILQ